MSRNLTLGVIGHVDHGKTALVRALTGVETDRLKEERERGLSIVLGFAWLETGAGIVDLIDVPGHEDFIRAMIGGATAIDGIILCIAANEGVMPQTVEHFNIARLLGIETGLIVVTKNDLVDAGELALAREEIAEFVAGTFLQDAPVIEVAAVNGVGVDAVCDGISQLVQNAPARSEAGSFFMPLDRVFTIRGFGLVVTGTLRGGRLDVGARVEIMPAGRAATIRGLQNHSQPVTAAMPGQRVAVNLRNVDRDEVKRGDVLAAPGSVEAAKVLDAELHMLADAPDDLRNGVVVRFLTGATEAMARIRLLDRKVLEPGESAMAQFTLDRDVATRANEQYLIRTYSPMQTIGGGRVLIVNAERHRRYDKAVTKFLATIASGDLERIIAQRLQLAGGLGIVRSDLLEELSADTSAVEQLIESPDIRELPEGLLVDASVFGAVLGNTTDALQRFHQNSPYSSGLVEADLAHSLGAGVSSEVLHAALESLLDQGLISIHGEHYRMVDHDPLAMLDDAQRRLAAELEHAIRARGHEALPLSDVTGPETSRKQICQLLLEIGRLVRLKTYDRKAQLILHADSLDEVLRMLASRFPYPAAFALKDVRDLLGSTRKYVVPLMEHLDASGITVRSGDTRRLQPGGE